MSVILGAATQQNLLSLQDINTNLVSTQNHLSTGLKVASAVDNAVAFFQADALKNRANDLTNRKDAIDQGISSLTTATQASQSVVSILQQLQGILTTTKTQTASQRAAATTQFNTLSRQLTVLVNDASYQGLNLVNSTKATLNIQFSQSSSSKLTIQGTNIQASGLVTTGKASVLATLAVTAKFSAVSNSTSAFDNGFNILQAAITKVQSAAQTLGGNVSFLQTRLQFTNAYETTLNTGSGKLILADVNEESANLVTLQTRQQLALQALSIATQSEQAVLRLFR